jgi:hypothetical protein
MHVAGDGSQLRTDGLSRSDSVTIEISVFYNVLIDYKNLLQENRRSYLLLLLLLSVGPAESRLMHCSLPRLIVLTQL